ncbi:MAG: 30S ribosomal protein S12 methylthiotransferase RimO [Deltaproteobacteria bacterium]|nr:30S ribosomal protein S12 methylthiotransferase RimO [Deltaproteobacteria bacterium]
MNNHKTDTNLLETIHFVSLGCPKNRVDSEVMAGVATRHGLEIVAEAADADVIVVNTCAFIESAKEESIDALLVMARLRKNGRLKRLVSAGCLSQRFGEDLAREMPEIDNLLGTGFPGEIDRVIRGTAPRVSVGPPAHLLPGPDTPRFTEPEAASAYIKIGDGCSRKCAFCAIPGIRGKARSRPVNEIVAEAELLVSRGVKELNLVAQDTAAYGRDLPGGTDLESLIKALSRVRDVAWIRLLYLYPDTVTDGLLTAMRDLKTVVPYLDVPIQHASAAMLRRMRRGHGPGRLRRLVERVRKTVPRAFLRTTVLVGHPGESDEDFAELLDFLEWARFDHLGAFRYSDEEDTAAFDMKHKVSPRDSYNRLRKVMALGRRVSRQNNRARKNNSIEVIVEDVADSQGYVLVGRHAGQAPDIDGVTYITSSDARIGDIIQTRVIKTHDFDLVVEPST